MGLMGWPVEHSFSPAMHNAAAAALGLDVAYVALPVRPGAEGAAVRGLAALGFVGVNVTVPHKQTVIPYLDEVGPAARAIRAVNTIKVARGRGQEAGGEGALSLVGHNTDAAGFMTDLGEMGVEVAGRACLVLGAGGAARAVAYGLADAGGRVEVLARRREQAETVVGDLRMHLPGAALVARRWGALAEAAQAAAHGAEAPLIVNATPVGMAPHEDASPWPEGVPFPAGAFVYDLVYNPRKTMLVQQARAAGCEAAGGLGMLLYQGALAFEIWLGVRPEVAVMADAVPE